MRTIDSAATRAGGFVRQTPFMVLLVGNDPAMRMKVAALAPRVNIAFQRGDRSRMTLPAKVDLVIVFRWVPHRTWWSVLRAVGSDRVKFCRGGATQAARIITDQYTRSLD